jgi:serine/threonine protein phosphatase PrpC
MHPHFTYPLATDGAISRRATIGPYAVSATTLQGSKDGVAKKPNEDAFSISTAGESIVAAVFDGCSSQAPIPWLTDQTGARFASHFAKTHLEALIGGNFEPHHILHQLNQALQTESINHHGASPADVHSLPATTATIAIIDPQRHSLQLNHVGDTFCILFSAGQQSRLITIDRNEAHDARILARVKELAQSQHITPREALQDPGIRQAIKDMFQATHNAPDGTGQGILNGDPAATQYFQYQEVSLAGVEAILIGSDGLIPPGLSEHTPRGRTKLRAILSAGGLSGLIQAKQTAENNDPHLNLLRYKYSDDATGIFVELI